VGVEPAPATQPHNVVSHDIVGWLLLFEDIVVWNITQSDQEPSTQFLAAFSVLPSD
jgi:hypothetical protein